MVRWVFYSLVVANVVYLGWQVVMGNLISTEPVPRAPAVEAGRPLKLLSEAPQAPLSARASPAEHQGLCLVLGPWPDRDDAQRGRVQLAAAGVPATIRAVSVRKDHLNWVYLPSYRSRDRALAVLGELQSRGVDSFVVKEGEDANAISLGYFSNADSAEGLRVKMRNAGYPAFVRETARSVTEYWLYLPDAAADAAALDDFLVGNPEVEQDRAACAGPATSTR